MTTTDEPATIEEWRAHARDLAARLDESRRSLAAAEQLAKRTDDDLTRAERRNRDLRRERDAWKAADDPDRTMVVLRLLAAEAKVERAQQLAAELAETLGVPEAD